MKEHGAGKKFLRLAIPVSLESVFQMGFNFIDQIIVGYLGASAVASVGLSNSIASIALLLYASTGVGAGVMVARAFGRKDLGEVSRITATAETLAGILGLASALLLVFFSQLILRLVGADENLATDADVYFRLYSLSIAPMILSGVSSAVFRSLNVPRLPLLGTAHEPSRRFRTLTVSDPFRSSPKIHPAFNTHRPRSGQRFCPIHF